MLIQIIHPRLTTCTVTQDDLHLASYFTAPTSLLLHFSLSSNIKSDYRNQTNIYDLSSPTRVSVKDSTWTQRVFPTPDQYFTINFCTTTASHYDC